MEFTEEQKRGFRTEFAKRKSRQLLVTLPFIVIAFGALLIADQETGMVFGISPMIMFPMFFLVVIGMVVFSLSNWRCPACNKYLGKGFNPHYCPKCGVQLKQ